MPKKYQFELPFDVDLAKHVRQSYPEVRTYRMVSKSLDARGAPRGRRPSFHYILDALVTDTDTYPVAEEFPHLTTLSKRPVIVGAGPGGLFCAVRLAEYGIPSILLERGDEASKRMLHIAKFWRYGELDPDRKSVV
jgi:uncharacterized FAD-dependent dehydrogenase